MSERIQKLLTGFAAGVMVAASFWSLLQPALESSEGMAVGVVYAGWASGQVGVS